MNYLKNAFLRIYSIPEKNLEKLINISSFETYKKGHLIAEANKFTKYFYLIKTGLVSSYYLDENNRKYIRTIFTEGSTTGCLSSLIENTPCKLTYDCLTDCEVYKFNFKEFEELAKNDIHLTNLYNKVLKNIFLKIESKIYDLAVLNATERYLDMKKELPNIENLIPQYQIASYLNITPTQLSRIRKDIVLKNKL